MFVRSPFNFEIGKKIIWKFTSDSVDWNEDSFMNWYFFLSHQGSSSMVVEIRET